MSYFTIIDKYMASPINDKQTLHFTASPGGGGGGGTWVFRGAHTLVIKIEK